MPSVFRSQGSFETLEAGRGELEKSRKGWIREVRDMAEDVALGRALEPGAGALGEEGDTGGEGEHWLVWGRRVIFCVGDKKQIENS